MKITGFFTSKRIIVISIIALLVLFLILFEIYDIFIDPPAWWRSDRQRDKRAILEYVENTYPANIKRKGGNFPLQAPAGPFKASVMYFELDGVDFSISAWEGKITGDTYYEAKAEKYIRENFIDGFMNDRKLFPNIEVSFISPRGHYGTLGEDVLGDVYSFEGSVTVMIKQNYIDGFSAPKDVGWFYDFYQYWMENSDIPRCTVYIYYRQSNGYSTNEPSFRIWFEKGKKTFSNEEDFYNHFIA